MIKNLALILLSFLAAGKAFCSQEAAPKYDNHTLVTTSGLITWFITTIAVLLLIVAIGFFLKRSRFVKCQTGKMAIEGQLALGPKERAVIIRAGNRKILLGVTAQNINYIADLGDDDPFAKADKK